MRSTTASHAWTAPKSAADRFQGVAPALGLIVVVLWYIIRSSSIFGWVAMGQVVFVAPWLCVLLVPVASVICRRAIWNDRSCRYLYAAASVLVLVSAVVLDADDQRDCFLGACSTDAQGKDLRPWWDGWAWVYDMMFVSMITASIACALLIAAISRARSATRQDGGSGR